VPHALDLPAGGAGRMLMIFQPAGFDQFLARLAGMSAAEFADAERMERLNEQFDIIGGVPPH
jgi:hypothetical protein